MCKVVTSRSSTLRGSFIPHEHCQGQPPFETFRPFLFLSHSSVSIRFLEKPRALHRPARPITLPVLPPPPPPPRLPRGSSAHDRGSKTNSGLLFSISSDDRSLIELSIDSTTPRRCYFSNNVFCKNCENSSPSPDHLFIKYLNSSLRGKRWSFFYFPKIRVNTVSRSQWKTFLLTRVYPICSGYKN